MRNKRSLILGIGLLSLSLVSTGSLEAATLDVCASSCTYSTIQSAINASTNGDTVLVSDGTYTENINFNGKAITVISENGPSSTTIDGNQTASVVRFLNSEGSGSKISGFTITGGNSSGDGGGIDLEGASPTIENCSIINNEAGYGGGICCEAYSSPTIIDCVISSNYGEGGGILLWGNCAPSITNTTITQNQTGGMGGGVWSHSSAPTITNCTINDNFADKSGGAIECQNSTLIMNNSTINNNESNACGGGIIVEGISWGTITNSIIRNNISSDNGGGIFINSGPTVIADSIISSNTATMKGGGIYCNGSGSIFTITNSIISSNATDIGGGIYCHNSTMPITDCIIKGNSASSSVYGGGGIYYDGSGSAILTNSFVLNNAAANGYGGGIDVEGGSADVTLTNSTISSNSAYYGGGFDVYDASLTMKNGILWGNTATEENEIYSYSATIDITYSDIQSGWTGTGNIDADPSFVGSGDYHLQYGSTCINAGTTSGAPEYDFEGDPRLTSVGGDGQPDMGADESWLIAAEVESKDDPIDVTGSGSYVDIYVELPGGNVEDIDINTVLLTTPEGSVYASGSGDVEDRDSDGIDDIKYKFNASSVYAILTQNGSTVLTITGELTDDTPFEGSDTVTVTGN